MKKALTISFIIIIIFPSIVYGDVNKVESFLTDTIDLVVDTREIDRFVDELIDESELNIDGNFKDIILKTIKGEKILEDKSIRQVVSTAIFKEFKISLGILAKILIITIISAILTNLQSTFEESSISQLANYITYMLIAILVLTSFTQLMELVKISVDRMISFMQILLPILLTLLVIAGGPNTKIIFHPMILTTVNVIGVMIKNIIFPLIYFTFIVGILSNISERRELSKLSDLGRKIITFMISMAFTIFIGILTIYGLSTKIDGITIRTAKFAVDKFVPIVGGFLSDSVDAVIGSTAILKNGIGIIGLIILILIILIPLIKIISLLLIYVVTGAIIEPISSKNITKFFDDISKTLLLVLISMVSITIMFFITITVIVDIGNNLLMLR